MILFIDMKGKLPKLERRLLARSGQGANFRFGQEHRTFLSVNEFHYLVESRCGAVAVGSAYLFPPLSPGGASLAEP